MSIIENEKNMSIIYVDESKKFGEGHLRNSYWLPRGWLEIRVGDVIANLEDSIVVTCKGDVFLKPYERKTKNQVREAMVKYLNWEEKLVEEPEYTNYFKAYKKIKI